MLRSLMWDTKCVYKWSGVRVDCSSSYIDRYYTVAVSYTAWAISCSVCMDFYVEPMVAYSAVHVHASNLCASLYI